MEIIGFLVISEKTMIMKETTLLFFYSPKLLSLDEKKGHAEEEVV